MLSLALTLSHPLTLSLYTHTLFFSESFEDVTYIMALNISVYFLRIDIFSYITIV